MDSRDTTNSVFWRAANKYVSVMDRVAKLLWGLGITIFVLLTLLVVGSVLSRQFLKFVPAWSSELQRYLAIWMTLLVSGPLINSDDHLNVRISFKYMSDRVLKFVRYAQLGIVVVIGIVLINWGTEYVLDSGTASVSPSMGFQMGWVYLILPITGWLFVLFSISRGIKIAGSMEVVETGRTSLEEE